MNDDFDADLTVLRVVPVTHDVTSFVLRAPPAWNGRFEAGQHLMVSQSVGHESVERCYTIATPPTRSGTLTITVKRHPDGVLSPWLHDRLRPGDTLRARGPYGEFTLREHPATPTPGHRDGAYLFLSAGSGITPMMSMARALADEASTADVLFVHSARTPADIIFRRELAALGETGLAVRVVVVCESESPGHHWDGPRGRLGADLLRWVAPDIAEREVFVCGPPGYMRATADLLTELAVGPARIHHENFTVGDTADLLPGAVAAPLLAVGVRVELKRTGAVLTCPPQSTVLDAVLSAGVSLRSSCRQGLCGTCKITMIEGQVDMRHQGGIRQREVDRGAILPCCSWPLGDLVLDA